jgi:hypothetical protein
MPDDKIVRFCKIILKFFYRIVINRDEPSAFQTDKIVAMLLSELRFNTDFRVTDYRHRI